MSYNQDMAQVLLNEEIETQKRIFIAEYSEFFNGLTNFVYNKLSFGGVKLNKKMNDRINGLSIHQLSSELKINEEQTMKLFTLYNQGSEGEDTEDIIETLEKNEDFAKLKEFINTPQRVSDAADRVIEQLLKPENEA
jgi:hypothetical protein